MPMRLEVHCAMPRTHGNAYGVVAAQHQRQGAGGEHVRHPARDLVEALLQVGGDGEHVAGVAQRHLLAQVHAQLVVVGRIERRDAAHALRAEAGAGPVGGAGIEGDADHGRVVLAHVPHVLHVGRLQERVDAGEVRQLAPREGRDRLVGEAVRARQTHVERPLLLPAPAILGEAPLGLQRLPALRGHLVEVRMMLARPDYATTRARSALRPALRERRAVGSRIMRRLPWLIVPCRRRRAAPWRSAARARCCRGRGRDRR